MGTVGRMFHSSECPECGSLQTPVTNTGHDEDGNTIRRRVCSGCGKIFGTVEIVLPDDFSFSKTDTFRKRNRSKRVSFFSADRIFIGTVKVIHGKPTNYCAKGKHVLRGNNVRVRADGSRHCRPCTRERQNEYRRINRDRINEEERKRYHRRKERLSDQNGILPRTASA